MNSITFTIEDYTTILDDKVKHIKMFYNGKEIGKLIINRNYHVESSYIEPDYRGRGFAKKLYWFAFRHFGKLGTTGSKEPQIIKIWTKLKRKGRVKYKIKYLPDFPDTLPGIASMMVYKSTRTQ